MRGRNAALVLSGLVGLAAIGAGPAMAGNDRPKVGQACATPEASTTRTCFTGPTAIQDAVNAAGDGGNVVVGPGHFEEHVVLPYGVSMHGQGDDTVLDGDVDFGTDTSIIRAYNSGAGFDRPVLIDNFKFRVSGPNAGAIITVRDANPNNTITITGNIFDTDGQCNPLAIWSYNSFANLQVDHNTFFAVGEGVLVESSSGQGQVQRTPATIEWNRFYHLARTFHGNGSTGVEVNLAPATSPGAARVVNIRYNDFDFEWQRNGFPTYAVIVDQDRTTVPAPTADDTINANFNNFKETDFGVANFTNATVNAAYDWWGSADGPNGAAPHSADSAGVVVTNPFFTKSLNLHTGAH